MPPFLQSAVDRDRFRFVGRIDLEGVAARHRQDVSVADGGGNAEEELVRRCRGSEFAQREVAVAIRVGLAVILVEREG